MINNDTIFLLIRAYSNQKHRKHRNSSSQTDTNNLETVLNQADLYPLCFFAERILYDRKIPEILVNWTNNTVCLICLEDIVSLLGTDERNYTHDFVRMFNELTFSATNAKALEAYIKLPGIFLFVQKHLTPSAFLYNKKLSQKVKKYIQKTQDVDPSQLLVVHQYS